MRTSCFVLALTPLKPTPRFEKTISHLTGVGMNNISVCTRDDGDVYLLMISGRLAVFGKHGKCLQGEPVPQVA